MRSYAFWAELVRGVVALGLEHFHPLAVVIAVALDRAVKVSVCSDGSEQHFLGGHNLLQLSVGLPPFQTNIQLKPRHFQLFEFV